jgi:uncharacterized protein
MSKQTALITGASGGIGLELATVFAREKYDLILVARSGGRLNEIAEQLKRQHDSNSTVIVADLGQTDAPAKLYAEVQARGLVVDVLVNNAGFGLYGEFDQLDLTQQLNMIQLNVTTLTHLTHLFLQGMKARKRGAVLNVASTAAFLPGPLMAVYYASKAFVLSLSEALAEELAGTGVTVTVLCPGPTQSSFQERAAMQDSKLVQSNLMSAQEVSEAAYQALQKGQRVVVPGLMNVIQSMLPRFLPRDMVAGIVKNAQARTH